MKAEPDSTIIRIEALEKQVKDLSAVQETDHKDFDTRLTKLDGSSSNHEQRITKLEKGLKDLHDSMSSLGSGDSSSMDASQIMVLIIQIK